MEIAKNENAALQSQIKKLDDRFQSVSEEKTYLEDILIHKTKEMEGMKNASAPVVRDSGGS